MDWTEDDFRYYDFLERVFTLALNVPQVVAPFDVGRRTLWFSVVQGGLCYATTGNAPLGGQGLLISGNVAPLELNVGDDGPMVCQQWTAISSAGTTLTVFSSAKRARGIGGVLRQPTQQISNGSALQTLLNRLRPLPLSGKH